MPKKKLIKKVTSLIEEKRYPEIKGLLPRHPEDIANLISQLPSASYKLLVFRLVPYARAVDVFEYLSTEEEEEILNSLNSQEIKDILNEMSPDDRTELFEELPAELVKKFMNLLSPEEREVAVQILNYPASSIGRLITPDFVQLYESMTIEEALSHVRNVGLKKETIYHCYVLDSEKRLIGIVSLKKLVLAMPQTKISEIMFKDVIKVTAFTDQEEAANVFKKYDLIVLPVVDNSNKLLGIVTFDDLVDILEYETTEDFEKIAAVLPVEKPYMEANIFNVVWKRSFWLIVLVVFESISALVLQRHHITISQFVALTFFIPVLVAMGGNTGTQSATIIIRSLAVGDIRVKDFFKVIFRESFVGVLIGFILALVGSVIVAILQKDWLLSIAVSVSMGLTILLAATVGASLPILFRKLKLDPALMSGPLIATIVDVVGILIYFEISKTILGL
ncbi:MAG: magnesium transporter [Candidatus Omnitrophota bacterium]|nr:MAG: magnesium transporter [Candidatus Omnitrophota bacterium]